MSDQNETTTSETPQGKPPVIMHNDGPVFAKVWENISEKGGVYYNVSVGKFYTDQKTGNTRETNNLHKSDLPRMQYVTGKAYESISQLQQNIKRDETPDQEKKSWLSAPEATARPVSDHQNSAAPQIEKSPSQSPEM